MKKSFFVKVSCDDELLEICKVLEKAKIDCILESKGNRLKIDVFGYDNESLEENYRTVRAILEKIKRKYNKDKEGFYTYILSELKYPVNKDLIAETLKYLGYKVKYLKDENILKTDVNLKTFENILKSLHEISESIRFSNLGSKPVKNLVIMVSYIKKKSPEEVVEEALREGFFREEEGKVVLNKDINLAKKYFLGDINGDKDIGEER
ncbi:hypothetical protein J422_03873 [Methanocaldococcus villosus KIN24-T80]|uniref:DUF2067 domain-containing protein n=1 Tax=Methanocaldococcus villosus KIN24-T80 TaxID=1069083 RepID=N6V1K7_9EURY|nr:DUF2067 family protein [Methanocaldococcus villosus]ENN96163.1 hypothetical protein J422_03873 [Methanocaldococcus villosus KIN24-T80]